MKPLQPQVELLLKAGQLLLKYNASTTEIQETLRRAAAWISDEVLTVSVAYLQISVSLGDQPPAIATAPGIHYNTAVQTRIGEILHQLSRDQAAPAKALAQLEKVEFATPRHNVAVTAISLACAASALAVLLGADRGAIVVAGLSTGCGLVVRHWLQRWRVSVFTLPVAAAFVGALLGGVAIRNDWTHTPGLALIVPCLMLVPGPHLINGLLDFIDNFISMSIARLALATGVLIAVALGLLIGIELMFSDPPETKLSLTAVQLNVVIDMLLAGVATAGFAIYYNTPWSRLGPAVLGGAVGHGLRSVAIGYGWSPAAATFLGGAAVGVCAAWMSRNSKAPLATIAFAGAVTMMPGLQMYAALRGVVQLVRLGPQVDLATMGATIGNFAQAFAIVAALSLGLVAAARAVRAISRDSADSLAPG